MKDIENSISNSVYKVTLILATGLSSISFLASLAIYGIAATQLKEYFSLSDMEYTANYSIGYFILIPAIFLVTLADTLGRYHYIAVLILLTLVCNVVLYFNTDKWIFQGAFVLLRVLSELTYALDMIYLQEQLQEEVRRPVVIFMFILESYFFFVVTWLNQIGGYHYCMLMSILIIVVNLVMRLFLCESYMWNNRIDRPSNVCRDINYICNIQHEPFRICYYANKANYEFMMEKEIQKEKEKEKENYYFVQLEEDGNSMNPTHSNSNSISNEFKLVSTSSNNKTVSQSLSQSQSQNPFIPLIEESTYTKIKNIMDPSYKYYLKFLIYTVYSVFAFNCLISLTLVPEYYSKYLSVPQLNVAMIYSAVLMSVLITVFVFVINYFNPILAALVVHILQILLFHCLVSSNMEAMFTWLGIPREWVFVVCFGLLQTSGRVVAALYTTMGCELSNSEYRGTTYTFLLFAYILGSCVMTALNMFMYGGTYADKEFALKIDNLVNLIAVGSLIAFYIYFKDETYEMPE